MGDRHIEKDVELTFYLLDKRKGFFGDYWSSSLITDSPEAAWVLAFGPGNYNMGYSQREDGHSVRPVRSKK